jgi:flagellar P-ring protein precursor FlgI
MRSSPPIERTLNGAAVTRTFIRKAIRSILLIPSLLSTVTILLLVTAAPVHATRIEDLTEVRGVRENQLTGYGLVVGLNGTGDSGQARFTVQSTAAMLRRLGATLDPAQIQTKNAAAVIITATLPPFANPGTHIDVSVSSLGNARSLVGGTLVQTPLVGADRNVYAVAQGTVIVGGFSASGASGSSFSLNHTTVGRVPEGAIVERRVRMPAISNEEVSLTLHDPSFVLAQRIVEAIDGNLGEGSASAIDPATVRVRVPAQWRENPVGLLAQIQALDVVPAESSRVVIDERTGTVVLGSAVRIRQVAIAQGGLTVEVRESAQVSQPNPLGNGRTETVPSSEVRAAVAPGSLHHVPATASLSDVIGALNALGANPRDLISIFQALRTAGALDADLEVQ